MPSFDVVSEVDLHNFTNAVDQANRIIANRFDFKGVEASFQRKDLTVTLIADSDFQIQQMEDMLRQALVKSQIDPLAADKSNIESSGMQVKKLVSMKNGLESELAKKIAKSIKATKLKVQVQIQGEQLRINGKKRDDLQQAIAYLKEQSFDQPLQFNNFRD